MKDPELYRKVNNMIRKDVKEILQQNPIKWKERNARILDIGCGDGSVTIEIWKEFMPKFFLELFGSDINENSVKFAQEHYGSENVGFITQDIQGEVPDELKDRFDHIVSSYAFHWVMQQEVGFTNVYKMLAEGGNCLIVFLGYSSIHDIYGKLSQQQKWKEDLRHVQTKFLSPYFNSEDPEGEIQNMMERIGFKGINVRASQKNFVYEGGVKELRDLMKSLNPFDSLIDKWEDFMDDYVKLEPNAGTVQYRLITAYGSK